METALTIASSDSSCGAGITRDLAVFKDFGVYGMCTVCTVTSQNSNGVHRINTVPPVIIADQIDCILKDCTPTATKIGMIYSRQAAFVIKDRIKKYNLQNIVLDTPRISKNSRPIITPKAFSYLKYNLLPLADIITPNADEVEALCGLHIHNSEDSKEACRMLFDMGAKNIIIKGGHLDQPVDILFNGTDFFEASGESYGKKVHGTGCTFSAAICAMLAKGASVPDAFVNAKSYINEQLRTAQLFGKTNLYYFI